jgi:hypothetical protein
MSSLAFPREALRARPRGGRPRRGSLSAALERIGPDAILSVVILALTTTSLIGLASDFNVDTWLALVTGREVWQSGIPHHETLTALSQGVAWIDQQWLSQLASYGIYRLGGLGLLGVVGVVLLTAGVGGAAAAARRLGGPLVSVLLALPLCVLLTLPWREIRTQDFAIPLFVAVAYLVARDARAPSRRVFWCLPLLVLWANLHGTVTLGAMLVALRGATVAWERRASLLGSARAWRRPLALIVGAVVSISVTPYGLAIVGYYRVTLLASGLRHAVTEWQPITAVPLQAVELLVLAALAAWSLWLNPARSTLWERLALLALLAGSISVQRNDLFFSLLALMIVPVWLGLGRPGTVHRPARSRVLVNGGLIAASLLATLAAAGAALARPASSLQLNSQRTGVLAAVQRATHADPSLLVFGDARVDDWLLWRDPALSGRIADDARFELLTAAQLTRLQDLFFVLRPNWKQIARGYRLLVLDRAYEPRTVQGFLAEPGRRVLYDDGEHIVILRSASQAGDD